jgi:hypothetical protein
MRKSIMTSVMKYRFNNDIELMHKKWAYLADDVYNDMYTTAERKLMAKVPDGWLYKGRNLHVLFGKERATLQMSKQRPVPNRDKTYEAGHPLEVRYRELIAQSMKLNMERESARNILRAKLWSFRSTERLMEHWPDIKPFLPKGQPELKRLLSRRQ